MSDNTQKNTGTMKISIHSANLFDNFGLQRGFDMMAEAGIEAIQFGMGAYMMSASDVRQGKPSLMDGSLDEILSVAAPYKEAAKRAGIGISHVHAPFPMWLYHHEDINARMPAIMVKSLAVTEFMESEYCLIHPAYSQDINDPMSLEEEWQVNRALYASFIPEMKKRHVSVLLENMFSRGAEGLRFAAACSDFSEAARWIDELNALAGEELFGFCFDSGHCFLARQSCYRALLIIGKRLKALHLHDNAGHLDQHQAPYTGNVDWESVLRGLREIGYRGDLNFEAGSALTKYPKELCVDSLRLLAATGRYFRQRILGE